MNSRFTQKLILFLTLSTLQITLTFGQTSISLVPPDCYPGVTPSQQDATATSSNGASPFATWKAAYDYAHTGAGSSSVTTINFAPGYYSTNLSGFRTDWGDASGGFVLKAGITVNGNGAVIDNTGAGSSAICFATMGNNSKLDGFTFIDFSGVTPAGAILAAGATGWEVNNCNFDGCDKGGGSGMEIDGGAGTINNCNFYKHLFATGSAMDINGGTTTLNNCIFSCNYRDNNGGRGGAIYMVGGTANFNGCTFDGNEAGGNAPGGAMSIEGSGSVANFINTKFTCNEANTLTDQDGGALNIESGATVTITTCTFLGNIAKRQGGAIRSAGGSSSSVNLTISNTTFNTNSTNTSSSKGGAIYLYNTITNLNTSFFTGNSVTGEGGAVFVFKNQSGNTATYDFSSNTMTSNTSSNNNQCTGRDVFTEMHINGSNNKLDALADGHHATNPTNTGTLEFNTTTSTLNTTINASGYTGVSVATTFGSVNHWTFNGYTASSVTGFDAGQRGMAYVLAADGSNFATANGHAVVFWRPGGSGNRKLSFVSFANGLDANANITVLQELGDYGANTSGTFNVKATHEGTTWKFYVTTCGSDCSGIDPRGFNYCTPSHTYSSTFAGTHRGIWVSNSSTANSYLYNQNYFRNTDETKGTGGSGSLLSAVCAGCPNSPSSSAQCPATNVGSIQGDAFRDLNNDGIMNAGEPLANVPVQLLDGNGNVVATTTTNSFGHYIFTGLATGTYQVSFGIPSGYSSATTTSQNNGAPAFDSDVAVGTGTTFLSPVINLSTSSGMSNGNDAFTGAANYYNVTAGYSTLVLPVTWSSITVKNDKCQNIVTWTTESETNNDYFVVERSKDGKIYGDAAMIDGQGDKRSTTHYEHKDASASRGVTYYRIKQVDFDGRFTYSPVVKVRNTSCAEKSFVTAYPNPVTDNNVTLEIPEVAAGEDITIIMYNHVGQAVKTYKINASENTQSLTLDITDLKSGIYMFHVSSSGGSLDNANIKFVKI